jgi:hypothetical protein
MRNEGDPDPTGPVLSSLGISDGWLVLHFERRVHQPPAAAWRTLSSGEHREHGIPCGLAERQAVPTEPPIVLSWCPGTDTVRWEVDRCGDGSRIVLTAWIDSDDPDLRARAGAGYHTCFAQVVGALQRGAGEPPPAETSIATLADHYRTALAG